MERSGSERPRGKRDLTRLSVLGLILASEGSKDAAASSFVIEELEARRSGDHDGLNNPDHIDFALIVARHYHHELVERDASS